MEYPLHLVERYLPKTEPNSQRLQVSQFVSVEESQREKVQESQGENVLDLVSEEAFRYLVYQRSQRDLLRFITKCSLPERRSALVAKLAEVKHPEDQLGSNEKPPVMTLSYRGRRLDDANLGMLAEAVRSALGFKWSQVNLRSSPRDAPESGSEEAMWEMSIECTAPTPNVLGWGYAAYVSTPERRLFEHEDLHRALERLAFVNGPGRRFSVAVCGTVPESEGALLAEITVREGLHAKRCSLSLSLVGAPQSNESEVSQSNAQQLDAYGNPNGSIWLYGSRGGERQKGSSDDESTPLIVDDDALRRALYDHLSFTLLGAALRAGIWLPAQAWSAGLKDQTQSSEADGAALKAQIHFSAGVVVVAGSKTVDLTVGFSWFQFAMVAFPKAALEAGNGTVVNLGSDSKPPEECSATVQETESERQRSIIPDLAESTTTVAKELGLPLLLSLLGPDSDALPKLIEVLLKATIDASNHAATLLRPPSDEVLLCLSRIPSKPVPGALLLHKLDPTSNKERTDVFREAIRSLCTKRLLASDPDIEHAANSVEDSRFSVLRRIVDLNSLLRSRSTEDTRNQSPVDS
jgi:hypothetical protein